jgi:hypothetical protein
MKLVLNLYGTKLGQIVELAINVATFVWQQ